MGFVSPSSLLVTLDRVNEALWFAKPLTPPQRQAAAEFIASRVGSDPGTRFVAGSYRGMPAPTPLDYRRRGKLFTGEAINSNAGMGCKIGFEATRALVLLDVPSPAIRDATARSLAGAQGCIRDGNTPGMFCCSSCSAALWRLLATGRPASAERLLNSALKTLCASRDGKGKWRYFPFYYTLLALSEIDLPQAKGELRYAAQACQRALRRTGRDTYSRRRRVLLERVLGAC